MSDILIKGMEMPTNENAVILITPSGDVWMIGDMPNEDTHLVKAKAVPVPPHGRLIDADELHKLFIEKGKEFKGIGGAMLAAAAWCIANATTIIPAEEGET